MIGFLYECVGPMIDPQRYAYLGSCYFPPQPPIDEERFVIPQYSPSKVNDQILGLADNESKIVVASFR